MIGWRGSVVWVVLRWSRIYMVFIASLAGLAPSRDRGVQKLQSRKQLWFEKVAVLVMIVRNDDI